MKGIITFLALCALLIGISFIQGCVRPSEALNTYTDTVRPQATAELDAITDKGIDKLCDMNITRVDRQMAKRGTEWAMGHALMCRQKWRAIHQALNSAATVKTGQ